MALGTTANGNFIATTISSTNTQVMTVICWVRFSQLPGTGGFQTVWSVDDNSTNFQQVFLDNVSGTVALKFTPTAGFDITILSAPSANTWYRVAVTQQPSAAPAVTWINTPTSQPVKVTNAVNGHTWTDTTMYVFNERGNDSFAGGEICGFQSFDRVLPEQEIIAGAHQIEPVRTNNLRYYLPLNANGGPEINRGGFGPKPTETGALTWSAQVPTRPRLNKAYNNKRIINTAPVISAPSLDSLFFGAGTTS